jgi:hypothetical protein
MSGGRDVMKVENRSGAGGEEDRVLGMEGKAGNRCFVLVWDLSCALNINDLGS